MSPITTKTTIGELGFTQDKSRLFIHSKSKYYVEFPRSAARVGDSLVSSYNELKQGVLKLLTPTDCVKDRLAAFYHWNDRQGLDQAVWVAVAQPVKLDEVKRWSKSEGALRQFEEFEHALQIETKKSK